MRATCTWGEGPDVLVVIEGTPVILYENPKHHKPPHGDWKHGFVTEGSFDLTINEAETFVEELITAIEEAKSLNKSYADYIEGEKNGSITGSSRYSKKEKAE